MDSIETQLESLNREGFVKTSASLNRYFRTNPDFRQTHAIFRSKSPIFGGLSYCYALNQSKLIEEYLEAEFRMTNPALSTSDLRKFGSIMHENGLHWSGCRHVRPVGSKGVPRGSKRPQRLVTQEDLKRLRRLVDPSP